ASMVKPDPKRAQREVDAGDKALAAGDVDGALAQYDDAARYAPRDITILSKAAALRAKLVQKHADAAEQAAIAGEMHRATEEMRKAQNIDPSNHVLSERLAEMEQMRRDDEAASPDEDPSTLSGIPQLKPTTAKRSFDLRGDTKSTYEKVGDAFGLRVMFDPDLPARQVRFRVQDLDFAQTMTVLTRQTGTFYRPVTSNSMFVAADTADKRKQYALVG